MKINMKFTSKGKVAIENFNNEELLEIFARYIKTLSKKYDIEVDVPLDENQNIVGDGAVIATAKNVKCDVETFFKELGRDIKVPLKKRLGGKLENVFKTEITEQGLFYLDGVILVSNKEGRAIKGSTFFMLMKLT